MGILLSIGASHPAITIQKSVIFPPNSTKWFSSLCRPQLLLHPNRSVKYILMMVATIPTCFLLLHTLQNNFIDSKTTENQGRYWTQKWPAPNQISFINGNDPTNLPPTATPIIFMYLRCGCCSWLLFKCRCMLVWRFQSGVLLCDAHDLKSIPPIILPISCGNQLLVDCCFTPICCCCKSPCLSQLGVEVN
jgi:hypothetical protein